MSEFKKVKIGDICKIVKGLTGIAGAEPGEYPLVVTAVERKTCSTYQFDCEAVCISLVSSSGHGKKSLNNVHFQSGKFALGTILCAVIPNNPEEVSAGYLHQYLQFYKDTVLVPLMKGAANVSLSMRDIATVEIPLPDFNTQTELAKMFVDMQSKLKEINVEFEKQSEYTKQLRQNILQDAIEGKLTAEWRKTHPVVKGNPDFDAEALFEKIQKEKKSDKKQKAFAPIGDDEKPFEIPDGWKWVRLQELCYEIKRGKSPRYVKKSNYLAFAQKCNVKTGGINLSLALYVDENSVSRYVITDSLMQGDIVINSTGGGTMGRVGYYETAIPDGIKGVYPDSHVTTVRTLDFLKKKYLYFYLKIKQSELETLGAGSTNQTELKVVTLQNLVFPLPPLKEQEEIVNKVESLLNKVSELENQIQERKQLSEKLVLGVIKEKLER